ncbi:MAG: phage tail sheath family protein, partial [Steroidobacteraceae bacterium]
MIELQSAPGLGLTAPAALPAIARLGTTLTAFVGRTLKGPVATPTHIRSFGEFQQLFGGLWQPSMLSYAIEQYFDNGGREAIVVRVVNGGQPPTVTLPAGTSSLCLRGISPGTREYLRASVDYDGIDIASTEHFNLVVQRLRAPGTELIESQEIFTAVSVRPASPRFVSDVLARSTLVRVAG